MVRGAGRHLFPSPAWSRARLGVDASFSTIARQWRREPDPVDHPRRDGDRGRPRDHRGVRLRPRFLVAHPRQERRRHGAERSDPGGAAAARARPGVRPFRRGRRSTPSARAATCSNTAPRATISPQIAMAFREHALRNPEAQMKKPMTHRGLLQGAADRRSVRHVRLQPEQRRRRRGGRDLDGARAGRSSRSRC